MYVVLIQNAWINSRLKWQKSNLQGSALLTLYEIKTIELRFLHQGANNTGWTE